jgi:transitional endoplasmic reticulum ATPase
MNVRAKQITAPARDVDASRPFDLALHCARNVYAASNRRMPDARALAIWLAQTASAFGLAETAVPDDEALYGTRRGAISLRDWHKVGAALDEAEAGLPHRRNLPIDCWLAKIAGMLELDRLETKILGLALQYKLDPRVARLLDAMSDCRGRPTRLQKDSELISLLLQVPAAAVDSRLHRDAKLQASGLLRLDRHGELQVLERLTSLMRCDVPPEADLYDQLLGTMTAVPLPWEAFAHLGREAEVAASVLHAGLARRERGINLLLYGPPGTGKTSFAAALAARIGVNLRPVLEADDDGGGACTQ